MAKTTCTHAPCLRIKYALTTLSFYAALWGRSVAKSGWALRLMKCCVGKCIDGLMRLELLNRMSVRKICVNVFVKNMFEPL